MNPVVPAAARSLTVVGDFKGTSVAQVGADRVADEVHRKDGHRLKSIHKAAKPGVLADDRYWALFVAIAYPHTTVTAAGVGNHLRDFFWRSSTAPEAVC